MKKFLFALCAVALALPCAAADSNNIKMVTYFPVPYASYGDLGVTGTCDVGLLGGQCRLDVGGEGLQVFTKNASSDRRALNTGSLIVRRGDLDLYPSNSAAVGSTILVGNPNSNSFEGTLKFAHNLTVNSARGNTLANVTGRTIANLEELSMYNEEFPVCNYEGSSQIKWQYLNMGGSGGVFLVCGSKNCKRPAEPSTKLCPEGYSGLQTREWNEATCSWSRWDTSNCECLPPSGESNRERCDSPHSGFKTREWDSRSCSWSQWDSSNCVCLRVVGEPSTQPCPDGYTGEMVRTYDNEKCAWSGWNDSACVPVVCSGGRVWQNGECRCPAGQSWNGTRCLFTIQTDDGNGEGPYDDTNDNPYIDTPEKFPDGNTSSELNPQTPLTPGGGHTSGNGNTAQTVGNNNSLNSSSGSGSGSSSGSSGSSSSGNQQHTGITAGSHNSIGTGGTQSAGNSSTLNGSHTAVGVRPGR